MICININASMVFPNDYIIIAVRKSLSAVTSYIIGLTHRYTIKLGYITSMIYN